jgi:hypothetical protein
MAVKALSIMLALCFFLTSCATGHYYYDVDRDGTRYYETMKGEKIKVTVDGEVYGEDGRKLGVATKLAKDWNLSAYEMDPSYSRCIDILYWDETVPCWAYGWQIPAILLFHLPIALALIGVSMFAHPGASYIF